MSTDAGVTKTAAGMAENRFSSYNRTKMALSRNIRIVGLEFGGEPKLTARRVVYSSVLSAVCAALPYPAFFVIIGCFVSDSLRDYGNILEYAGTAFVMALAVTLVHALLLGVPAAFALARFKALRYRYVALGGVLVGALPVSLASGSLYFAPWTALFGLIGASAFWLGLTVRRRDA